MYGKGKNTANKRRQEPARKKSRDDKKTGYQSCCRTLTEENEDTNTVQVTTTMENKIKSYS